MDYGRLIRRSWQLTWRHRLLWVLGLFATSTVGSCGPLGGGGGGDGVQWRARPEDLDQLSPELERALRGLGFWASQNIDLIVLLAAIVALVGLALLIVSLVAQGGMARATAELALGRRITGGEAWRAGLRMFWRYLSLWLLLIGLSFLVALAIAAIVSLGFLVAGAVGGPTAVILAIAGGLLGLLLVLLAIPVLIAVAVVVAFAQRAIAVEDAGPLAGLRVGFRLVREHLGTSFLVWLINLGLGIAAALTLAVGAVVLAVPLAGLGLVMYVIADLSAALAIYLGAALLVWIAAVWLLSAVANTFFWNYWTLAYLNFTGRLTGQLEAPEQGT